MVKIGISEEGKMESNISGSKFAVHVWNAVMVKIEKREEYVGRVVKTLYLSKKWIWPRNVVWNKS